MSRHRYQYKCPRCKVSFRSRQQLGGHLSKGLVCPERASESCGASESSESNESSDRSFRWLWEVSTDSSDSVADVLSSTDAAVAEVPVAEVPPISVEESEQNVVSPFTKVQFALYNIDTTN